MFIFLLTEVIPYCHPTMGFVLMTFGRHLQQVGDKSRLVFDSLRIVPGYLPKTFLT
jgi:hypothetical protein